MKQLSKAMFVALFTLAISSCKKDVQVQVPTSEDSNPLELSSSTRTISPEFEDVRMCTEKFAEGVAPRAAAIESKRWRNGSVIVVRMFGGTSYIRSKVIQYANAWSKAGANITFKFVNSGNSDIRITFYKGGSWSTIGTDALRYSQNSATMNFGWLKNTSSEADFSSVIIHEFGHALGLIHEHQNPLADIPWNRERVYRYHAEIDGWNRAAVDHNVFNRIDPRLTLYTVYDRNSIMHYPVSRILTDGNYSVGWNTTLSSIDKIAIRAIYRKFD